MYIKTDACYVRHLPQITESGIYSMVASKAICDMHSHLLPCMDDGCRSVEESVQVLRASYDAGVRQIFVTPHYYPIESVETFLKRRDAAMQVLSERLAQEKQPLPEICVGAEVAYRPGLGYEENLDKLCLGNSRYLLLEMPVGPWSEEIVRSIRNICRIKGITPIIAHIEQYLHMQSRDVLTRILEQDVLVQMNAEYLLNLITRRKGKRLLKSGVVHLLGSDCHNMTSRKPNVGLAVAYLEKKGMTRTVNAISSLSQTIFREAAGK